MTALALRRGTVTSVDSGGPAIRLTVDVGGQRRPAMAYERLTGPVEPGDDVVVNVLGRDLGLGSGGFDILHVNLTRGLEGTGTDGAHVMKLNYSSMQHAVHPVEERTGEPGDQPPLGVPVAKPVAVISLHGQLPCVAWSAAERRPGVKVGFVQTAGGALPGSLSDVVRDLIDRGLLCGQIAAAPAFDAEHEAISVAGAIHAALTSLGWDACIAGPGPGILGSATALGHGGLAGLDTAHAALSLGCPTIVVPRMSSSDARKRHRGLSHHTATVLELMLRPALVAVPAGAVVNLPGEHEARAAEVDLEGYAASQLPARTMGRSIEEDALFFRAALAGGVVLADATEPS
jgi:hypothetical protein